MGAPARPVVAGPDRLPEAPAPLYDALVFFSLLHATTVQASRSRPSAASCFRTCSFTRRFASACGAMSLASARAVGYVSGAERRLARAFLRVAPRHEEVVGIGVDPPPQQAYPRHQQDPADDAVRRRRRGATSDEAPKPSTWPAAASRSAAATACTGRSRSTAAASSRTTAARRCSSTSTATRPTDGDTSLVLMGVKMMKVPEEPYLRLAGVLPDRERMIAYEAADVTLAPASDDLLAQPVLESLAVGTPVLASAR